MEISKATLSCTPEEAGYSSERLDFLDQFYAKLVEKGELQCVMYGMARNGKVFAQRAMGKQRFDNKEDKPMPINAIRRIASITKVFTAVAILKLVEDGEIQMKTPVATYLKEFEFGDFAKITIKHLLTHTSGLSADQGGTRGDHYPLDRWDLYAFKNLPYKSWIEGAIAGQLYAKPGTEWSYCTLGYALLGEIITRVTGVDCEEWILANIAGPLGMEDTFFNPPKEKWDRIVAIEDGWSDPYQWEANKKQYKEEAAQYDWRDYHIPKTGGGLFSTVGDLLIFGQMLLNNGTYNGTRILSRKSVELLHQDCGLEVASDCWNAGNVRKYYGFGVELYGLNREGLNSRSTYGHEGAGFSGLYIDPEEHFVVVYFIPNKEGWHTVGVEHASNIVWSGIL